jgi:hypothetical protein
LMAIRWRAIIYNREVNYYHISQVTPRPFTHISQVRQMQWQLGPCNASASRPVDQHGTNPFPCLG